MLRRNNLDLIKSKADHCTTSCQTDQFLLYIVTEQKLEEVYHEYRNLQIKYEEANTIIEFLQYKNKYLEDSLFQISIAFSNKVANNNLQHIGQIKELDYKIKREMKELEKMHNSSASSMNGSSVVKSSFYQENRKSEETSKQGGYSKLSNKKDKSVYDPPSILKYKKISPAEDSCVREEDKQESSFTDSHNEFLSAQTRFNILTDKMENQICESERVLKEVPANAIKSITHRCQKEASKIQNSAILKKKKSVANKQNLSYDKLVKMQAELKMKEFMDKFQMDSRMREQSCQQQDEYKSQSQSSEGCKVFSSIR